MKNELSKQDILNALQQIPPSQLNYSEWVSVGMALKDGGYDPEVWENWSRNDPRHHENECYKKWKSFKTGGVSVGTIVHMAQQYGWTKWIPSNDYTALDWDDVIQDDGFEEIKEDWVGTKDLIDYLEILFEPNEFVSYVTSTYQTDNGRFVPSKGIYNRTQKELIESLKKYPNDITDTIGSYEPMAGAWIRFNPVDGKGISNDNVTRFKYALIESDTLTIADQDAMYRKFQLPIAVLVHSGGKSLHAIVKVDANDREEYRQRVEYLYDFFKKKGIDIDTQNRNPSRLSRLPGVIRKENKQYIVDKNIGRSSWIDWVDYVEGEDDELPPFVVMSEETLNPPPMPPEIVVGILRRGHKMLISGDSKAGKSWLMMELAIAVSEGQEWLGFQTEMSKVLYVNLEIDAASCTNRFMRIYDYLNNCCHKENLFVWNLRGKAVGMNQLVPKIVRRIKNDNFGMIIIDPIYKVQTGDENAAGDIADFCNQFDKLATETGASIVYCHHHSKGSQGNKKMVDRASGSGVFARDPDAILDLIELDVSNEIRSLVAQYSTAWQLEFSLREFPNPRPIKFWFTYPTHVFGGSELNDCYPEGSEQAIAKRKKEAKTDVYQAFEFLKGKDGMTTTKEIASYLNTSEAKITILAQRDERLIVEDGRIKEKNE